MLVVFILLAALDFSSFIDVLPELIGVFIFLVILGIIIAGAIQIFTKGGPFMEYAVIKKGVGYKSGDASKAINTATLVGSVLGGSVSGAGISLINISREMDFMKWKEMRSVTGYKRDNSIIFYRKELVCPFDLYCSPDIFKKVIEIARERAPQASVKVK